MKLSFMDTPAFDKAHRAVAFYGSAAAVAFLANLFMQPSGPVEPRLEQVEDMLCLTGIDAPVLDSPVPAGCVVTPSKIASKP